MAEELDVDAMLEAPYKKGDEPSHKPKENGYVDHRSSGKKRGHSRSRSKEKEGRSGRSREEREKERHRSRSPRDSKDGGEKDRRRDRDRDRGGSNRGGGGRTERRSHKERRSSREKGRDKEKDKEKEKEKDKGSRKSRSRSRERLGSKKTSRSPLLPPLLRGGDRARSPMRRGDRFGLGKKRSPSPLKYRIEEVRSKMELVTNHNIRKREKTVSLVQEQDKRTGLLDELTPEERDARTVFCMQLSQRVRSRDLEEFFSSVGKVRDVRLITCNKTRRFKGISYVEFRDTETVPLALGLSGQKLLGIPIIVQPTQAEKNRQGVAANVLAQKGTSGPMRLYVGSLHFNITEDMLRGIFEPFGKIDNIQLIMDPETGRSKGYGFITFHDAEDAKKALEQLNGFELAGRPMKVGHVTERSDSASGPSILDSDELDRSGIDLGATGRLQLMAKLAEGTGLQIPQPAAAALNMNPLGGLASQPVAPPIATQCFMLSNMFDPQNESNPNWDQEIRDDVIEECNKHGGVLHVFVDKASPQGNVYVKCPSIATAVAAIASLHGRWFAGRIITAAYVPLINYHNLFPDAMATTQLLAPSSRRA